MFRFLYLHFEVQWKTSFPKNTCKSEILKSPRFASCGFTQVLISQNLQNFIMTYYFSYITDKSKNQRMLIIPYSLIVKISFLTGKILFMFMSFFSDHVKQPLKFPREVNMKMNLQKESKQWKSLWAYIVKIWRKVGFL